MSFVEYRSRIKPCQDPNYVRISKTVLSISNDTWENMGKPKKVKLYYEEVTNRVGVKASNDKGILIVTRTLERAVKQVMVMSFLKNFKIVLECPMSCRIEREGELFVFSLKNGIRSK